VIERLQNAEKEYNIKEQEMLNMQILKLMHNAPILLVTLCNILHIT